jgi:hypothetical protein
MRSRLNNRAAKNLLNKLLWLASKRVLGWLAMAIFIANSDIRSCFAQDSAQCFSHAQLDQYV